VTEQLAKPPLERLFDLGRLSDAGDEIVLQPKGEELAALAEWAEVASVENFQAKIDLTRKSSSDFHYEATIEADLTQNCVVTLEPVKSHISKSFSRELHLIKFSRPHPIGTEELAVGAGDDDLPEELDSPHFDIAGPVLEEFSLAIDPYPRAPGVAFESPAEQAPELENPFAVLKRLKTGA
jgi:uncharacterized metal-binding protein YceD (DUF177 family)